MVDCFNSPSKLYIYLAYGCRQNCWNHCWTKHWTSFSTSFGIVCTFGGNRQDALRRFLLAESDAQHSRTRTGPTPVNQDRTDTRESVKIYPPSTSSEQRAIPRGVTKPSARRQPSRRPYHCCSGLPSVNRMGYLPPARIPSTRPGTSLCFRLASCSPSSS